MAFINVVKNNLRLYRAPLDCTDVFETFDDFEKYVHYNGTAYAGQLVYVKEKDSVYLLFLDENEAMSYRKFGSLSTENSIIGKNITVNIGEDEALGGIKNGEVIDASTSITELFEKLFHARKIPEYIMPELKLTAEEIDLVKIDDSTYACEVGTEIANSSLKFDLDYNKNDAGNTVSFAVCEMNEKVNLVDIPEKLLIPINGIKTINDESNYEIYTSVEYGRGDVKQDNFGTAVSEGIIEAGVVKSNVITIKGFRKAFFGSCSDTTKVNDGEYIRKLSGSKLNPVEGDKLTVEVKAGDTAIVIAVPSEIEAKRIISKTQGADLFGSFNLNKAQIYGVKQTTGTKEYNVYSYIPEAGAFTNNDTLIVEL